MFVMAMTRIKTVLEIFIVLVIWMMVMRVMCRFCSVCWIWNYVLFVGRHPIHSWIIWTWIGDMHTLHHIKKKKGQRKRASGLFHLVGRCSPQGRYNTYCNVHWENDLGRTVIRGQFHMTSASKFRNYWKNKRRAKEKEPQGCFTLWGGVHPKAVTVRTVHSTLRKWSWAYSNTTISCDVGEVQLSARKFRNYWKNNEMNRVRRGIASYMTSFSRNI